MDTTLVAHFVWHRYCQVLVSIQVTALAAHLDNCVDCWLGGHLGKSSWGPSLGYCGGSILGFSISRFGLPRNLAFFGIWPSSGFGLLRDLAFLGIFPILGFDYLWDLTLDATLGFGPKLVIPSYLFGWGSSNCLLGLGYFKQLFWLAPKIGIQASQYLRYTFRLLFFLRLFDPDGLATCCGIVILASIYIYTYGMHKQHTLVQASMDAIDSSKVHKIICFYVIIK